MIYTQIKEQEIDIVAFQEVRFSTDEATGLTTSQLEEVKKYLPNHKWMVVQPAGPVRKPENAYWKGWTEEGNYMYIDFCNHRSFKLFLFCPKDAYK